MQVFGRSEGKDHLEDLGLDGKAILKWIFKEKDEVVNWIDLCLDRGSWGVSSECGNEHPGSIKFGEFPDCLSTC
jgi:hypothetical protein